MLRSRSTVSEEDLSTCNTCGRTFLPDALSRHQGICAKTFNRKRRVFESGRQRIAGLGISITKIVKPDKIRKQGIKQTNWRQKHADFINAIRSARQAQHAVRTGKPLPPPPPPSVNPDYIQCPHCRRRFNQTAAARHIGFCGERTNTFGVPVKPLNKRAAADIQGSRVAIRKAYDNIIVRRKAATNPFAYAHGDGAAEDVMVYSTAFGGKGPNQQASTVTARRKSTSPRRNITSPRRASFGPPSSKVSLSPRQQSSPRISPRQQASPRQLSSPRIKQSVQESSVPLHPAMGRRFESSFQKTAPSLPPATMLQRTPQHHLPTTVHQQEQQQLPWQQPALRQKMASPPQDLSPIQHVSPPNDPHQSMHMFSPPLRGGAALGSPPPLHPLSQGSLSSLPPWQQALTTTESSGQPAKSMRLPNGQIRRSRLVKSGKPKGNVRFADNVQVKTFGDTLPGPNEDGMHGDFNSAFASNNAMPSHVNEEMLSKHQDLMSLLKNNYGDDVMLATPGNHMEEMMKSRHPVQGPPSYANVTAGRGGRFGMPDLTLESTGLQRDENGASSHLTSPSMRTSYQDNFGRIDNHLFESTTPLDFGSPAQASQPMGVGYGAVRRSRPIGGSLRGPGASMNPSPSDFSKLSISGNVNGPGYPSMTGYSGQLR